MRTIERNFDLKITLNPDASKLDSFITNFSTKQVPIQLKIDNAALTVLPHN